ncbi:MAG: RNA polymerase factor sigma-54 [candidate division WOR-3 bacterium]
MEQGLHQILRQELRLTPQLLMNLRLLQLPTLELEQLIRQELQTNPILEEVEEDSEPEAETATEELGMLGEPQGEEETPAQLNEEPGTTVSQEEPELGRLETALDSGELAVADFLSDTGYLPPGSIDDAPDSEVEQAEPADLGPVRISDVLLPQLRARLDAASLSIAEAILDNLNDDGFLIPTVAELAGLLGVSELEVENVRLEVQHLEGGGIGARDLREALLRQLEVQGYEASSVEYRMISDLYDRVLARDYATIASWLMVTEERIREAMTRIAQLDPRPGRRFGTRQANYVQPDFVVEWSGDRLVWYAADERLPRLRLSAKYRDILRHPKGIPQEELVYARKKLQNAVMLLRAMESRRRTLAKVMNYVVENQQDFLRNGREHLKPISIKQTGQALGINPSTISRAVQGKYVETPYAILPLRFFFTSGTDGLARHSVKDRIRRIVEEEDRSNPLSDERIVDLLKQQGIGVSRRVVAKYRAEMNIPNCSERRAR